jgi:hypothetical protein
MYLEAGFLSAPRSYMNPTTGKFIDFVGFAAIRSGWALEGTRDVPPVLQRVRFQGMLIATSPSLRMSLTGGAQ